VTAGRGTGSDRVAAVEAVVVGTLAVFGLLFSSAVIAVIVAGMLQWGSMPPWLDDAIPVAVLVVGLAISGRVAVDVAGGQGVWCTLGAAVLVAAMGTVVSRSSEAHGDGIEAGQILVATLVVLLVSGTTALLVGRRRGAPARQARRCGR
jgi:hypothetical protein